MFDNKFFNVSFKIITVLIIILLGMRVSPLLIPLYNVVQLFLIPVVFAVFLYYVLRPVVEFVQKKVKKRGLSVVITLVAVLVVFGGIFGYGGAQIGKELIDIGEQLKEILDDVISNKINIWPFEKYIPATEIIEKVAEFFKGGISKIASGAASSAGGVFSAIGNIGTKIFLTFFMLVFFLKDGSMIMDKAMKMVPSKHRELGYKIRKEVDETLAVYISGQILVSIILGVLTIIGYMIIGLPNAFALGVINLVFNLIPYVGPIIGFAPALIMALKGGPSLIFFVIIVAVVVQQLEGNFISPWVIGDKLKIHPLTVVIVITAAISQAGIIGAFAAIPVYSIIRVIIKSVNGEKLEKKHSKDADIIIE